MWCVAGLPLAVGGPSYKTKRGRPARSARDFWKVRSPFHLARTCFSRSGKLTFWSTLSNISLPEKYECCLWDEPRAEDPRYHPDSQGQHLGRSLGSGSGVISRPAADRPLSPPGGSLWVDQTGLPVSVIAGFELYRQP